MRFLRRFFPLSRGSMPRPSRPLAVIGDLHGRVDLLEQMVEKIAEEAGTKYALIFLGDYIDRGENSAKVLTILQALQDSLWPSDVICLKGNHEVMMLEFLDAPEDAGAFWLKNGGAYTLASFGIHPPAPTPAALCGARNALRSAMSCKTEAWLRALPLSYSSGNVFMVHAGANPHYPLDQQDEAYLIWGHPDFFRVPRSDNIWIAHGHTIFDVPAAQDGRISIDTGAYATHRLTAALISDGVCRFMSTGVKKTRYR